MSAEYAYLINPREAQRDGIAQRWDPKIGVTMDEFMEGVSLPDDEKDSLLSNCVGILSKCVPPSCLGESDTGLVVGHVQSGKTLSFTGVAALAKDNGFRVVILITGISNLLQDQSKNRVARDLRMASEAVGGWTLLVNPDETGTSPQRFIQAIGDWEDESLSDEERKTVFITVMKNHKHLQSLSRLLDHVGANHDLGRVPALIIDDEADQASLNTLHASNKESTTYRRIQEIRSRLPTHTYLQYTATPQANLLLALADSLSPNFVHLLTPGRAYIGGEDFFGAGKGSRYISTIPDEEIESAEAGEVQPPSLRAAFALFIVGLTCQWINRSKSGRSLEPRSMLIHPSHKILAHSVYYEWIDRIRQQWLDVYALPEDDPDRFDLIAEVKGALLELQKTAAEPLPDVQEVLGRLGSALRKTTVMEVNAKLGSTPNIEWSESLGHILVGGQAMDRGFTVQGLTVTYMPRSIGGGNADTVQQRGRFFGYKADYLGYCRVFLSTETHLAFRSYVAHETSIRSELQEFAENRSPLDQWRRRFILDRMRPTRPSVISSELVTVRPDEWTQLLPPIYSRDRGEVSRLNAAVEAFIDSRPWISAPELSGRTEVQTHSKATALLSEVLESLLLSWRCDSSASANRLTALQLMIKQALVEIGDVEVLVVRMGTKPRVRELKRAGRLNIFQGRTERVRSHPDAYRGDRMVYGDADQITVQLHDIEFKGVPLGVIKAFALGVRMPPALTHSVFLAN